MMDVACEWREVFVWDVKGCMLLTHAVAHVNVGHAERLENEAHILATALDPRPVPARSKGALHIPSHIPDYKVAFIWLVVLAPSTARIYTDGSR